MNGTRVVSVSGPNAVSSAAQQRHDAIHGHEEQRTSKSRGCDAHYARQRTAMRFSMNRLTHDPNERRGAAVVADDWPQPEPSRSP